MTRHIRQMTSRNIAAIRKRLAVLLETPDNSQRQADALKWLDDQSWSVMRAACDEIDALKRERDHFAADSRTLRTALARATRAARERDQLALATINPSVQPLVDALLAWRAP